MEAAVGFTWHEKMIRELVRLVLINRHFLKWTLQGFGMLRTYLDNGIRLCVWDDRFRVPNVSMIHTHPWHFRSLIVVGNMRNQRFTQVNPPFDVTDGQEATHFVSVIKAGEGGGLVGNAAPCALIGKPEESYFPGDAYFQSADEVHASNPVNGTITLCDRERLDDPDHALVFWEIGNHWVSAEPRLATPDELDAICLYALRRFMPDGKIE